ncbi:MAG: SMC-Scp complex subunit ScpB [Gammaproteobacteria bacterium GWF2_41_13]|nr:MAG: SMC-Scp complex subunit ScpB [Gammaproteobacteria bacterium GWF2_41_13]
MTELTQLHYIIEGALLSAGQPLTIDKLLSLFDPHAQPSKAEIQNALDILAIHYQQHSFELKELASGYQLQVKAEFSPWMIKLFEEKTPRYSRALLETLVLIAYRQPITRSEIEDIRGVAVSTQIIRTLLDHEWIHVIGYREVPGKPALYGTTKKFLDHFGLKSLTELPTLPEIRDLSEIEKNVEAQLTQDVAEGDTALSETEGNSAPETFITMPTEENIPHEN